MKSYYIFIFFAFLFFTNCKEINTTNPEEAYKLWTKSNKIENLNIVNAEYWQSSHWSSEYKIYLEMYENKKWWNEFKKVNHLIVDTIGDVESDYWEKPKWFNPSKKSIKYKQNSKFDQGSRYFEDTLTGKIFIYEIQL